MMGVGKSTLGKKLAHYFQLDFVDTDDLIEKSTGLTIPQLFEQYGEAYFRNLEHEVVKRIEAKNAKIYAVGGGLPCFENNIERMKKLGIVIYLKRSPKELAERILQSKDNKRPLLQQYQTKETLTAYLEKLLEERERTYLKAHLILERQHQNAKDLVEALDTYLKKALGSGV